MYVRRTVMTALDTDLPRTSGINQNNLVERAEQVAKMRHIYGKGSRVVVFLGDDIVVSSTKHPIYSPLDNIISWPVAFSSMPSSKIGNDAIDLSALLERAYFSRVWVI